MDTETICCRASPDKKKGPLFVGVKKLHKEEEWAGGSNVSASKDLLVI